jgi:hypothetical protein
MPAVPLYPLTTEVPAEISVPKGVKKDEMQQTHMTKAIEKSPNLPGLLELLSLVFLSRTKLTSYTCSPLLPLEASLPTLICEKISSELIF